MYNKVSVKNSLDGETIYLYLKRNGFSENYIKHLRKKEGYIKLNGEIAFTNKIVKNGDILELYKNPNTKSWHNICTVPLNIVYEDDDILTIKKPSNMPTIPSKLHLSYNLVGAINNYMLKKDSNFTVRIINRLDKETSGLVCVAKHSVISNLLNENDYIQKTYLAIVTGKIEKEIIIEKGIMTTKNELGINNHKRIISDEGKKAITYVKPVGFDGENTLCEFKLKNGRTHQIRVHMASINHPLLGDSLYGETSDKISHTALVCYKMKILNPITKKEINLKIDLPNDFKKAFNKSIT